MRKAISEKQDPTNQQLSSAAHLIYKLRLMNPAKSITWVALCMQGNANGQCVMNTKADVSCCKLFLPHLRGVSAGNGWNEWLHIPQSYSSFIKTQVGRVHGLIIHPAKD